MKSQGLHRLSVVVVGAGASGLMAAISAARAGARVLVIEQKEKIGKKILATGNGRCNFTNRRLDSSCYFENAFALSVIGRFDVDRTLTFFRGLGLFPHEKDGYFYPASEQAASVVNLLAQEAEGLGISFLMDTKVERIQQLKDGSRFELSVMTAVKSNVRETVKKNGKKRVTAGEIRYEARKLTANRVILACGGKASPALGSDGSGYDLAASLGHRVVQPLPALTGIQCEEPWFKQLAGVRVSAKVTIFADGQRLASSVGELQLVDYGISGIPVFQVSRYVSRALAEGKKVHAELCFFPEISDEELMDYLVSHGPEQYGGLYPEKLLAVIMQRMDYAEDKKGTNQAKYPHAHKQKKQRAQTSSEMSCKVYDLTRKLPCTCREVNGFDRAQVTCGGVALEQVDPDTLESLICPGLYFAGELLDVDGICGGYNLQWAWSSGWLAGNSAAK